MNAYREILINLSNLGQFYFRLNQTCGCDIIVFLSSFRTSNWVFNTTRTEIAFDDKNKSNEVDKKFETVGLWFNEMMNFLKGSCDILNLKAATCVAICRAVDVCRCFPWRHNINEIKAILQNFQSFWEKNFTFCNCRKISI